MDPCSWHGAVWNGVYHATVLSRVGVCPKKLITLFSFPIQMQNIFVHPCMGFSSTLWEGSINSILSQKEENRKTGIAQIEENGQMVLFMFWCEVCHQVQATTYQMREYINPYQLVLHGQMELCYKFYLF